MHLLDYVIFGLYMLGVLWIGYYFLHKNEDAEDYYVGGRTMSPSHIGLSIVATDVGGGFSIGLGGLGFTMGLSGSWMLFTGLIGAWLSAVFIIPKIKAIDQKYGMMTYPDFLKHAFDSDVATVAAVISGLGYLGFTGGQVLAGSKLIAGTMVKTAPFGMDPLNFALYVIGVIIIGYTVMGGLKAVIYTDTVQWIILLFGLIVLAIPLAIIKIGGFSALQQAAPQGHLSLTNVDFIQIINWMIKIVPIWLVGMTLYQRMYACKDEKDAKKAWYIAGVFEWPIMAFMGAFLGMCGRILFPEVQPEMGLPMTIKTVLPIGVTGIVVASYFSAIMSTADSCLVASSGNLVNDLIQKYFMKGEVDKDRHIKISQITTLIIGVLAIALASQFRKVLDAILYAYSFMVSGLFVPTLGAYFWEKSSTKGAFWGMISGGTFTLILIIGNWSLPFGLEPTFYGIVVSAVVFLGLSLLYPDKESRNER